MLGRRLVHAADEYYLLTGRPFPEPERYEGFDMHEDGIGMARTFELEFLGASTTPHRPEGRASSPRSTAHRPRATGPAASARSTRAAHRRRRVPPTGNVVRLRARRSAPVGILTAPYGAQVLAPLVADLGRDDVRLVEVANEFFGGNVGRHRPHGRRATSPAPWPTEPEGHRYLLPDVCLSEGRFLDGLTPFDLPRPVEVVATDGVALRRALEVGR